MSDGIGDGIGGGIGDGIDDTTGAGTNVGCSGLPDGPCFRFPHEGRVEAPGAAGTHMAPSYFKNEHTTALDFKQISQNSNSGRGLALKSPAVFPLSGILISYDEAFKRK